MCTSISITTKNGDIITGRTNEFGAYYRNDISFFPRNSEVKNAVLVKASKIQKSKYAMLGGDCGELFGDKKPPLDFVNDGMNEKGLSMSALYYPNKATYKLVDSIEEDQIDILHIGFVALAMCANVEEVKKLIEANQDRLVIAKSCNQPGHFFFIDSSGNSIVVEPDIPGRLEIKPSNGIMTNSPNYEWHLANLNTYANIQQFDTSDPIFTDLDGEPALSYGISGAFGLPGDTSPTSRFIKANYLAKVGTKSTVVTAEDGVLRLLRILNNFDIIPGMALKRLAEVKGKSVGEVPADATTVHAVETDFENTVSAHTDHTIVKDLTNLKMYYKDWNNQSIRYIELADYDVNGDKPLTVKMLDDGSQKFQKVTLS